MTIVLLLSRLLPILLSVAYLTLAERGTLAAMHRRAGPDVSGLAGLMQPIWDGLKLALAEPILPVHASPVFLWSPTISFVLSQLVWAFLPLGAVAGVVDSTSMMLGIACLSSVSVFGVLLAGWSSFSRYAFLGGCRSCAGMVSYELPMSIVIVTLASVTRETAGMHSLSMSSFGLFQDVLPLAVPLGAALLLWCVLVLAESRRAPFDLPEAEAELVAGFNVEYSSLGFALFFLAEYASMAALCGITACAFLRGMTSPCPLAVLVVVFFFPLVWVRNSLPRYRPDQLMRLGWQVLLPLAIVFFVSHHTFSLCCDIVGCMLAALLPKETSWKLSSESERSPS
jgi:NADH:ubiquinone oxidoreductase subunit H